jgi:hypothetical protein
MIHLAERDILMAADYLRGVPVKVLTPSPTTRAQLYRALGRLGVDRRRLAQPEWWGVAAERFRAGAPIKAIARELGRARRPVQYALSQMGLR